MKIRQGFVSNSSSSSFIATGFRVNEDRLNDRVRKLIEDGDLGYFEGLLVDSDRYLAHGIEEEYPKMLDPDKVTKSMTKMKDLATELGVDDAKVGICYGSSGEE